MKDLNFLKFLFLFIMIFVILISRNYAGIGFKNNTLDHKIKSSNLSLENVPRVTLPYLEDFNLNYNLNDNLNKENQVQFNNELGFINSSLNTDSVFKYQKSELVEPRISAEIVLVADLKSGKILWGKNLDKNWPIASLTKLITAAYVLKNFNLKDKVTILPENLYILNSGSQNTSNIIPGEIYLIGDLVKLMLLTSSNETAEILANLKNRDSFILGMNNLIKEWGTNSTYLADPTGLLVSNQSTAIDLLKIIQKIFTDYPDILNWSKTKNLEIRELKDKKIKRILNIHPFAGTSGFLGGKTGFIPESKQNLISVFNISNRPVVILVLGSDDRAKDTQFLYEWFINNFKLVD